MQGGKGQGAWLSSLLAERAQKTVHVRRAQCEDQPGLLPKWEGFGRLFKACRASFGHPHAPAWSRPTQTLSLLGICIQGKVAVPSSA